MYKENRYAAELFPGKEKKGKKVDKGREKGNGERDCKTGSSQ